MAVADTGLEALQKQLKDQAADVEKLKAAEQRRPPVQPQVQAQSQQQGPPSKDDIEKMFWKDPLPMVDAIAKRAAWETEQRIAANTGDTQRAIARKEVRSSDPDVFDKFEVEIEAAVATVAPQFQGNINVWQNALNIVRGQHVDEIITLKNAKKDSGAVTPPNDGPGAPSVRQPPAPKEKALTGEQQEVARGLRLSDEQYKRGIEKNNNQEKFWPKVVTFDSEEKRRATAAAKSAK